jgi:hypothetical protein
MTGRNLETIFGSERGGSGMERSESSSSYKNKSELMPGNIFVAFFRLIFSAREFFSS